MKNRWLAFKKKINDAFEQLETREKRLVLLLGIVAICVIFFGSAFWIRSVVNKKYARNQTQIKQLQQIVALEGPYKVAKVQQEAVRSKLERNQISIFSLLQTVAQSLDLSLSDLNEKATPINKTDYSEISVAVNLKSLSIDKLVAFLTEVEKKDLVKITQLKLRSRFDAPDLLDVQMTVTTWKKT